MIDVQGLVQKIERADARRQDVRARLVCDDVQQHERGSLDTELMGLNHTIEHYAKLINQSIADAARRGRSPGRIAVGQVVDLELKMFLEQVRHTCDKLVGLNGKAPKAGSNEALQVKRDQLKAERLKRDAKDRLREYDREERKTEKARVDLKRERERLEREKEKVTEQRDRAREQDDKLAADLAASDKRRATASKSREAAERERKGLATQLRASRDARRRGQLEQRVQKLGTQLKDLKRRADHEGKARERLATMRAASKRELEQLDQALERLEKELTRLGSEGERLGERTEQIDDARAVQEGRITELEKAERTLKRASSR